VRSYTLVRRLRLDRPMAPDTPNTNGSTGFFSRQKLTTVTLLVLSILALYLCWLTISPFLTPLAWAVALAIFTNPIHRWLRKRIKHPGLAAGLSVAAVALLLIIPVVFVSQAVVGEAIVGAQVLQSALENNHWAASLEKIPHLAPVVHWVQSHFDIRQEIDKAASSLARSAPGFVAGSAWVIAQIMITLYTLFFLFRDRRAAATWLRSFSPLTESETSEVFRSVRDTIDGVIYGYLAVATVQGFMGGLMFWFLGLPTPLLWGAVMAVVSAVPVLGAPVVWAPTAIGLALQGDWKSALILSTWGAIAIGLIDNILYPFLVGNKLRLHTLPVFYSLVGGVIAFGLAGVVLGPVVLACTLALLDIWKRRTQGGKSAEEEAAAPVIQPAH
jgi:predicted PurR-regulated permease PerM